MTKPAMNSLFGGCIVLFSSVGLADNAQSLTEGKNVYESFCAACHGSDGTPQVSNTPDFSAGERLDKSDIELLNSIMDGKGAIMPGWAGILTDEDCQQVLQFIRAGIATIR